MSWIVLAFALQLGYVPNSTVIMYTPPTYINEDSGQVIVEMETEMRMWNTLYVGGSLTVPTWPVEITSYWPQSLQSIVFAGVRFGPLEIGWSHLCTHPVVPFQPIYDHRILWEGAYDEFHIKLSGKVGL